MDDNPIEQFRNMSLPQLPRKQIITGVVGLAAVFAMFSMVYQVEPEEVGVILRFGQYNRTTNPGLHFKLPFVEAMTRVPVQRQLSQDFGFQSVSANARNTLGNQQRRVGEEAVMLTGDLNVAVVEWIVQYRVADPRQYLFEVRNLEETFHDMTEAVMREAVGDRTVTEVVTIGRQDIESTVEARLQELVNQYQMGLTIDQVVLQDVNPPDPVRPSWDEVSQAQQQRDRLINEALAEYNAVIPRARGEAQQAILQAEGYALDRVNRAQGEGSRFSTIHAAYRQSPTVTRRRMYLETMQQILPQVGRKVFVAEGSTGVLPLLSLDGGTRSAIAALTDTTEQTRGNQ